MNDIEMLFEEVPVRGGRKLKPLKVAKTKPNPLDDVSSWVILRELLSRHYKFVLSALFWIAIGALIVKRG